MKVSPFSKKNSLVSIIHLNLDKDKIQDTEELLVPLLRSRNNLLQA